MMTPCNFSFSPSLPLSAASNVPSHLPSSCPSRHAIPRSPHLHRALPFYAASPRVNTIFAQQDNPTPPSNSDDTNGNDDPSTQLPNSPASESTLRNHVTVEQAHAIEAHALALADGIVDAVARTCAQGVVHAFTQCYQADEHTNVFVVVGAGITGLVGLHTAAMLKKWGFEPAVYKSKSSYHTDIPAFCEEHGLPIFDFVPSTLTFYFDVVIDALLGTGFDGGDIHPHFWNVFEMLVSTDLPIASVDVPSGWDLTIGPRDIDITADTFIKPDLLVSLAIPKLCSTCFAGSFHFVAGRHVPQEWLAEQGYDVPLFPGEDSHSVMFRANAKPFKNRSGEVYSRPGTFEATLFTKNPKRKYVDPEDHDDLWDELD